MSGVFAITSGGADVNGVQPIETVAWPSELVSRTRVPLLLDDAKLDSESLAPTVMVSRSLPLERI